MPPRACRRAAANSSASDLRRRKLPDDLRAGKLCRCTCPFWSKDSRSRTPITAATKGAPSLPARAQARAQVQAQDGALAQAGDWSSRPLVPEPNSNYRRNRSNKLP